MGSMMLVVKMTGSRVYMGVSENRRPKYSALNSRILIVRTPK